jgi:hypothetical protein
MSRRNNYKSTKSTPINYYIMPRTTSWKSLAFIQSEHSTNVSTEAEFPVVGMEMARREDSYQLTWPDLFCQIPTAKACWRSWLRHCATIRKVVGLFPIV